LPNDDKIHNIALKYYSMPEKYQHFPFQGPPKYTQIRSFGMKINNPGNLRPVFNLAPSCEV
jgi:hypothetical protein